ncbi:MAG: PTS mannitol transporter subunit IICB, partial [Bacteroidales bacterium]|nr:PTS mannitol transporter subunit IICB [Bacteroidales bacterium]
AFEVLVDNFSVGIIGFLLAIVAYLLIGGVVVWLTQILKAAVEWLIAKKLLPLVSVLMEPAKVMFLNNAINHGIFDVLGVEQVREMGSSIIFLIETNPGPGFGVLLACSVFGDKMEKQSAPGAAVIHFLGGIHEIYFPYVLSRPALLIAPILGSFSALLFYTLTGTGLVAPAAPGSVIAILAMAPKGKFLAVLLGMLIATAVSFLIASPILKLAKKKETPTTE